MSLNYEGVEKTIAVIKKNYNDKLKKIRYIKMTPRRKD